MKHDGCCFSCIKEEIVKMSEETEIFEINKCVLSKLWYTSYIIYQERKKSFSQHSNDTVDFIEPETTIANLVHSQNDSQHQWITNMLLDKLTNNATFEKECIQLQQGCIQIRHALQICKNAMTHLEQGLLAIYKNKSESKCSEIFQEICNDYFMFLKQNVYSNPFIVCWIMNELFLTCSKISANIIYRLCDFHFLLLKELLESHLSIQKSINDNTIGCILSVISKMNIVECQDAQTFKWLFPMLLKSSNSRDIQLALYARADNYFFKEWSAFNSEVNNVHIIADNQLNNVSKIRDVLFHNSNNSCIVNNNILIQRVVSNKLHWVVDILDICYTLTINGKYNDVSQIMSTDLFQALWPALLFKALNHCSQDEINLNDSENDYFYVCDSIKYLIEKCDFDVLCESALKELHYVLVKSITMLKYILNCAKEEKVKRDKSKDLPDTEKLVDPQQKISIKGIFNFQYFNSLLVLKMATNLHEQNYEKVQGLLRDLHEPTNVFKAYYAMLSALKAILLCDSYDTKQFVILDHFSNMRYHMQELYPLSLRIQVIENIFSFLFLRHEDFDYPQRVNVNSSHDQPVFDNKQQKQHSVGFICNKNAVKDMLSHLEDIMAVTENEYLNMKRKNECMEEVARIEGPIASIGAAITDAAWRLELYSQSEFTESATINDGNKSCLHKSKIHISLDGRLISNRTKENVFFYQQGSASDETKIKSNSSSESDHLHNNNKWRKRSRNVTDNATTKDISSKPLFINFMLATMESLIIRCLWRNDYAKAEDVIEASNMRTTALSGEVQFSKALHSFRKNMYKEETASTNKDQSSETLQSSMLENIRLAAQEGIQTSRQTSQFETFLASQETNLRMLCMDILNSNEILTICALDLALTMCQMHPISHNICEVALKYLKLCKTFDNTEYAHFFHEFYQLLYEKKDGLAVDNILCDAKIPFSLKECKEKEEFWTEVTIKHREFKESQVNKNVINKILKESNYLPGLKILSKITAGCCGTKGYMQNVCSHLQLLHTITPTEHAILTISDLLKIPLHYYFGYQIFELKVEPNKLEPIAHDLQVNLAYSILTNACPRLFHTNENTSCNVTGADGGCIILNKASCKSDLSYKVQGPNQCVSEILAELLKMLRNLNLNQTQLSHNVCRTISKHQDLQNVLTKTSRLASLDLSELSAGDETLTFLLNTWNLMFLHTSLTVWANQSIFNNLQHTVSLMSVGYLIGDLGLVTLATLRAKLLNDIMLDDKCYFMQLEELNEPAWQDLDIVHDPRVIFVMANEYFGTPYIRVCDSQSLDENLTNAFSEYLDHYSSKSEKYIQDTEKQETILLPHIVEKYEAFVTDYSKDDFQGCKSNNSPLSVHEYFKSSNGNVAVQYVPPSYTYSIILEYPSSSNVHYHRDVQSKTFWKAHSIRSSLLQYLEGQCWIVSYLLQRIHNESPTILENSCDNLKRTACLENLLVSPWLEELKPLFEDNQTLAAIFETIPSQKLWSHFEFMLSENKWNACLKLINALPNRLALSTEIQCLKDKVLSHIVSKDESVLNAEILQCLYQIKDVYILSQTILYNINRWHINVCENALLYAVHHEDNYKLPLHCKLQLNEILHRVLVFHKMLPYCITKPNGTWYDIAYCTEKIDPLQIIRSLINADKFDLCLEWMECQAFSLEISPSVTEEFLIGLLKSETQNYKQTLKFFQALPLDQSISLCKSVLKKLESIDSLRFICDYLLQYCKATETIKYRRTQLGIDILSMLDPQERALYIHLIKEPLLILEQLLMNCKFESIQKILAKIQDKLDHADIARSSFDAIIRFYAKKSLDCRVSLQCDAIESKSRNVLSSISETECTEFVMPMIVPTREEWVPNDKARKCSCCKNVIFSMFNRRHHCRRCGRVICATCSQHRMQVSGYPPSVLVRVCDDCKKQTTLQMHALQGTPSTASSEVFDYWRLSRDQKHNETIREEFSFEYAPNISLCLAILNLHSENQTYTSFLLDCCDEMKRLLQPVSGGRVNPEVDHTVIIKMIRSLLVAAKVKCARLGLNTGLAHCDRFLSQVDLIASLVQSDCLHLIPSDNLDEHTLRKLRDLLIEKEQWTLALDVSTKAGLDTQGVWATWGKACLKMGYFDQAREKFFHCLDKVQHENFEDWVLLHYPKEPEASCRKGTIGRNTSKLNESEEEMRMDELNARKTEFTKNRPPKDPPLLTEILQILDNLSTYRRYQQFSHQQKSSNVVGPEILSNFGSFKIAGQKQSATRHERTAIVQNVYYNESLDYLLLYGSYNSILEFFLLHEEYEKCLTFILENDLDPDLFLNAIYFHCLRNGNVERLHEAMANMDPSLLLWKRYLIHVCHNLERRQYLNILYQLQLFMKDSVRAAMTCIRFYLNDINSYTDLCAKSNFLLDAQKHLESELQMDALNRRRRKSTSSMHSTQGILTMEMEPTEIDKHINTICRQMEITKFLAGCEREGRTPMQFLNLFPGKDTNASQAPEVPTLFGNQQQKIDLAVLAILCGRNIEEGFGIGFRIMQDYNLPQQKVYSLAGHILTVKNNIPAIEQLIKCCHTSGIANSHTIADYVLSHCVKLLLNHLHEEAESVVRNDIYNLVRLITDIELKINAYIECKQLKSAYLLAVKHSRAQDIRKILKESDRLGQNAIKAICIKWLQQEPKLQS